MVLQEGKPLIPETFHPEVEWPLALIQAGEKPLGEPLKGPSTPHPRDNQHFTFKRDF